MDFQVYDILTYNIYLYLSIYLSISVVGWLLLCAVVSL